MLPVTLGLGLINFNQVINTFFAARYIDPELAPSAIEAAFRIYMLPQGMFSVAIATVLFPSLSRLAARQDVEGFRSTVSLGLRQIGFLLLPASAVAAVLADTDRAAPVSARRVHGRPDRGRRRGTRRLLDRPDVQRDDADAEPRVLQPSIALDPDVDRAREPRVPDRPERGVLPARRVGDPARDVAREPRRDDRARRRLPPADRPARRAPRARHVRADPRRVRRSRALPPSGSWYLSDDALGRSICAQIVSVSARDRGVGGGVPRGRPYPSHPGARRHPRRSCGAPASHEPRPHPQLLDRRAHRPRQVDARRPHPRAHADADQARDARAGARLDGARARARDHDQGPGRARAVEGPHSST